MKNIYVVSRHNGLKEWLIKRGFVYACQVIGHINDEFFDSLNEEDIVIGVLPPWAIARINQKGARFFAVELPNLPKEWRGKELTPEQMDAAGAEVREVRVSISHSLTPMAFREIANLEKTVA